MKKTLHIVPVVVLCILLNVASANLSAVELFYDDDTYETWGIGSTSPDQRFYQVVRFHSPWERTRLLEARFYILETIDGQNALDYSCSLFVMDSDRTKIFVQEVCPDHGGWVSVDLRSHVIAVPEEFYVGIEVTHNVEIDSGWYIYVPVLCFDTTDPDGESWWVTGPPTGEHWIDMDFLDMMIRAIVSPLPLAKGWGVMWGEPKGYVRGPAELYMIGEAEIELVVTFKDEEYSKTWEIREHYMKDAWEIFECYNPNYGFFNVKINGKTGYVQAYGTIARFTGRLANMNG